MAVSMLGTQEYPLDIDQFADATEAVDFLLSSIEGSPEVERSDFSITYDVADFVGGAEAIESAFLELSRTQSQEEIGFFLSEPTELILSNRGISVRILTDNLVMIFRSEQ